MRTERTYEFKLIETISPLQHLALLCKMLEAAEEDESKITVEPVEFAEDNAA